MWYKNAHRAVLGIAALAAGLTLTTPGLASADTGSVGAGSSAIDWVGHQFGVDLGSSQMGQMLDPILGDFGSLGGGNGQGGAPTHQRCNAQTTSGGAGVTTTRYSMGRRGPMSFRLSYETQNVPDRIVVSYQGRKVADTGYVGDNANEGTGSIIVRVPAGTSDSVVVTVTGPSGTLWDYTVYCPS